MEITGWISAIFIGLVLGVLGRLIIKPGGAIGWIWTIVAGVVGAIVGGWVAGLVGWSGISLFALQVAAAAVVVGLIANATKAR